MGYSLLDFCRDAREILKAGSSRARVDEVKGHMERLLVDPGFVGEYFNDRQPLIERLRIDAATGKILRIYGRQTGAPASVR
jgi:hypothetical protein